jgi:hypothetical protein
LSINFWPNLIFQIDPQNEWANELERQRIALGVVNQSADAQSMPDLTSERHPPSSAVARPGSADLVPILFNFYIFWPMPLFLLFITQSMHIISHFIHNSTAMFP